MRDPKRIEAVLERVREVWERNPDLRLGQIVINAAKAASYQDLSQSRLFYIEDEQLLEGIANLEKLDKI
jgi:uncharacterized protein YihD (DUF1040 family)